MNDKSIYFVMSQYLQITLSRNGTEFSGSRTSFPTSQMLFSKQRLYLGYIDI